MEDSSAKVVLITVAKTFLWIRGGQEIAHICSGLLLLIRRLQDSGFLWV